MKSYPSCRALINQRKISYLIIKKIGETYIAYPVDDPWLPLRQVIGTFPEEYMLDRDQPVWEEVTNRTQF